MQKFVIKKKDHDLNLLKLLNVKKKVPHPL